MDSSKIFVDNGQWTASIEDGHISLFGNYPKHVLAAVGDLNRKGFKGLERFVADTLSKMR